MIFANYNYKSFHNGNKDQHPKEWCDMVNENYRYCKTFNRWKCFLFRFWVFVGRVQEDDVPSFHPYWRGIVNGKKQKELEKMKAVYALCKKDPSQIKYHFNLTTTLGMIEDKIKEFEKSFVG